MASPVYAYRMSYLAGKPSPSPLPWRCQATTASGRGNHSSWREKRNVAATTNWLGSLSRLRWSPGNAKAVGREGANATNSQPSPYLFPFDAYLNGFVGFGG